MLPWCVGVISIDVVAHECPDGRVSNSVSNDPVQLSRFDGIGNTRSQNFRVETMEVSAELVKSLRVKIWSLS